MKLPGSMLPLLLASCAHPSASVVADAQAALPTDAAVRHDAAGWEAGDASDGDAGSSSMHPAACADGGPAAWYLVARGPWCPGPALVWIESDGVHRAPVGAVERGSVASPSSEVIGSLQWLDELAGCIGPSPRVTSLQEIRTTERGETVYRVTLGGHDFGGHECHASVSRTLTGEAIVDEQGLLVSARMHGTETVTTDNKPRCRADFAPAKPLAVTVERSCTPP